MPAVCFHFKAHLPIHFKKISFFELGKSPDLIDHQKNYRHLRQKLENIYLPVFSMFHDLITTTRGDFHFSVSLSGTLLDQIEKHFSWFYRDLSDIVKLEETEMIASTYFHSMAYKYSFEEFMDQVDLHSKKNLAISGKKSNIFSNADPVYESGWANHLHDQHFKGVFLRRTDLGIPESSPGFLYQDADNERLRLILINEMYSDLLEDGWRLPPKDVKIILKKTIYESVRDDTEVILLQIDLEKFGKRVPEIKRRINLIKQFVQLSLESGKIVFLKPSEILEKLQPVDKLTIHEPIYPTYQKITKTALFMREACRYLYSLEDKIKKTSDKNLIYSWRMLQSTDHILQLTGNENRKIEIRSPYPDSSTIHEHFLNYMNALSCIDIYATNTKEQSIN